MNDWTTANYPGLTLYSPFWQVLFNKLTKYPNYSLNQVPRTILIFRFTFRIPEHIAYFVHTTEVAKSGPTGNDSYSGVNLADCGEHGNQRRLWATV
jgi:hypothetical protein